MADPICRWQNPFLKNVVKLISYLPKTDLPKTQARDIVNKRFGSDFFQTAYQTACQLGLYYENEQFFFPKFKHEPTNKEVQNYLKNWIIHYPVPNPYTKKGFKNIQPFSLHSKLCKILLISKVKLNWDDIEFNLFGEKNTGSFDILCNSFKYSNVIEINYRERKVSIKEGVNYTDLKQYLSVDTLINRNDKEYFFDLFPIPSEIEHKQNKVRSILGLDIDQGELDALDDIENNKSLSYTEKIRLAKSRIGQGLFRRNLISECKRCPITGIDTHFLLIASHIKPWSKSDNFERLHSKNGLLLSPTYDKLFDKGYISFDLKKNLIISSLVSKTNRKRLHLSDNMNIPLLPVQGREKYLEYHRDVLLKR